MVELKILFFAAMGSFLGGLAGPIVFERLVLRYTRKGESLKTEVIDPLAERFKLAKRKARIVIRNDSEQYKTEQRRREE